jgi:hypothetical protein
MPYDGRRTTAFPGDRPYPFHLLDVDFKNGTMLVVLDNQPRTIYRFFTINQKRIACQ